MTPAYSPDLNAAEGNDEYARRLRALQAARQAVSRGEHDGVSGADMLLLLSRAHQAWRAAEELATAAAHPRWSPAEAEWRLKLASAPDDNTFAVEQVCKCLHLAKMCVDSEIAGRLVELAGQFARRALELGADPLLLPVTPSGSALLQVGPTPHE